MAEVSYIDAEEFVDEGYLHEANRRFFHPLGLALEIEQGAEGIARLRVWDHRDDPNGISFGPDLLNPEKGLNVKHLWEGRLQERVERLGYMVQPIGGVEDDDKHIVKFTADGQWTMQHPLACRPNLFHCRVHLHLASTKPLRPAGEYEVAYAENDITLVRL